MRAIGRALGRSEPAAVGGPQVTVPPVSWAGRGTAAGGTEHEDKGTKVSEPWQEQILASSRGSGPIHLGSVPLHGALLADQWCTSRSPQ